VPLPPPIDPEFILAAYRLGAFPMSLEDGDIGWFSPDPRGIMPIDARFHLPHGFRRFLRRAPDAFTLRSDTAFTEVMLGCADRDETWISPTILSSYSHLHQLGHAHSIETWQGDELVGGLYGVALGGAFFGESMFSRVPEASKVALLHLVAHLRARGFVLLDIQWLTPHLSSFGAIEIPRPDYLALLNQALQLSPSW